MNVMSHPQAGLVSTDVESEKRSAPRYISLIRAAKLVGTQGEFVCVIRDVSRLGIKVKTFHPLPADNAELRLVLQNGDSYALQPVRQEEGEGEASFTFAKDVEVERLIKETWTFPRRALRLALSTPVVLRAGGTAVRGRLGNLSQQGAQVSCDGVFAIDQKVTLEVPMAKEVRATVRWRGEQGYGLVFEDTFSLAQFAILAGRLQCPVQASGRA